LTSVRSASDALWTSDPVGLVAAISQGGGRRWK
jgi:hypothetical protein